MPNAPGLQLTGRDVALKMLRDSGIYDVQVVSVDGFLTDHYNPAAKTINWSPEVYNNATVAAAAMAAHENGSCRSACPVLYLAEPQEPTGSRGTIQLFHCELDPLIGLFMANSEYEPAPGRYLPVCPDRSLFRSHPARGVRGQPPGTGLAERCGAYQKRGVIKKKERGCAVGARHL